MRPENSRVVPSTIVQIIDKPVQETMNRKTLQVLQQSAGDKENLVGGGRKTGIRSSSKESLQIVTEIIDEKKAIIHEQLSQTILSHSSKRQKKMPNIAKGKSKISAEELTSIDEPSEKYWSILAEKRRIALEAALVENQSLHERIKLLEEENETTKQMLAETSSVIELLQEMVAGGLTDESNDSMDVASDSVDLSFDSADTTSGSIDESFD